MRSSYSRGSLVRPLIALGLAGLLAVALTAPSSGAATSTAAAQHRDPSARVSGQLAATAVSAKPTTTLNSVGSRYVRAAIPIKGYTWGETSRKSKLALQRFARHHWVTRATKRVSSGVYEFPAQHRSSPGWAKFRTVLYVGGRRADVSNILKVRVIALPATPPSPVPAPAPVPPQPTPTCTDNPSPATCPQPPSTTEFRTVDDQPDCAHGVVNTHQETRTINWTWDDTSKQWVQSPTPWTTVPNSAGTRPATTADCPPPPPAVTCAQDPSQASCIKPVDAEPAGAMLPDLRIKDLTKCGAGDMQRTGGTCFMIDPSAPYNADFPGLAGHKLLKFPVITLNMGAGPGEIVANRSSDTSTDWQGYQNFYDASGNLLGSMLDPTVQFYFAGDGHNHWHVRDFDEYDLLDATGTTIAHAEKHGYCMQDNTSWDPWQGMPGVPSAPVYAESTSCGKGLTGATSIVHGLSKGWGDTYPTTLPDQAIDITGLPDGIYTVRVHADAVGAVRETNEDNNTAEVQVQITGDTVQVIPGSSQGGV